MRILQVTDKSPHEGGIGTHVATLAAALEARGHDVLHIRIANRQPDNASGKRTQELPWTYGLVRGQLWRNAVRNFLAETRPQLIHVHQCFTTMSPLLLAELRRSAPVVGTLHDVLPFCFHTTRRFAPTGAVCGRRCGFGCFSSGCVRPHGPADAMRFSRRWMMHRLSLEQWRRFPRVVVPSTFLGELAHQHGIDAERTRLVPHGTPAAGQPIPHAQRPQPALIVYLGSLVETKGPGVLVEALARIRAHSWEAILIGDGPMRAALEASVRAHGLGARIRFAGHVAERGRIDELLGRARLLVLPSLVPESFAMAGIEALAQATPVVSFGLGGVQEWLRHTENGLIARDGSSDDLARQLSRLVDDPALAQELGMRGHALVAQRFSAAQAIDGLLAVYDELTR